LYMSKCAVCHGPDGTAKTAMGKKLKVQDAHTAAGKMTEDQMITIVTDGKGQGMAGYGKTFGKDQIKSLVDYYRSLGK
jgi:mono/diheme cytochrome c family protein